MVYFPACLNFQIIFICKLGKSTCSNLKYMWHHIELIIYLIIILKAGIFGDRLLIVPESETSFLYCMREKARLGKKNYSSIGAGTKCMVVIAEGKFTSLSL